MQKDGGNMLAIKRYVLPGVLAFLAYWLLGLLFSAAPGLYWAGLAAAILFAYLVRFCDDISDFPRDLARNKVLLGRKMLILLACVTGLALVGIAIGFQLYWLMLPPGLVAAQFLLTEKYRDWLKPLFLPAILVALFLTVFAFTPFVFLFTGIAILVDIILIVRKR